MEVGGMALFESQKARIGGAPITKTPTEGEPKRLWDWYHKQLVNDLTLSVQKAKDAWSDGKEATKVVEARCFKTFANKNEETMTEKPLVTCRDMDDTNLTGQKVVLELRVGGRLVKDVFPPRTVRRNKKDVEVAGSREQGQVVHQKAIGVLEELLEAVKSATKDSAFGKAIHQTAKDATSPANRVKGEAAKAAKLKEVPYNEELDNWVAVKA